MTEIENVSTESNSNTTQTPQPEKPENTCNSLFAMHNYSCRSESVIENMNNSSVSKENVSERGKV